MVSDRFVDEPITSSSDDTLGRAIYAQNVADLIVATHTFEASLVFGLTGPWGSGKSSLVELVEERLRSRHPNWIIVRFTPWAAGDVASLLADYYSALIEALPQSKQRRVRRSLGAVAAIAAPLATTIPVAGASAAEAIKIAGQRLTAATDYASAFAKASADLNGMNKPILVIADDIDRLHREELLAFLKVVRLVGRFPGVSYLIAYDESTVHRSLDAESPEVIGRDFMEKIVQYPLSVPAFSEHQLFDRLNRGLETSLQRAGRVNFPEGGLSRAADILKGQLRTPRSVARFIAQVSLHMSLIPEDEIDDVDLMLVTLLRLAFPSVYRDLPRWRSRLLSGNTGELDPSRRGQFKFKPFDPAVLTKGVSARDQQQAIELLRLLFPALEGDGSVYGLSQSSRGIREESYFDRYLAMGVPEYDVRDAWVVGAANKAADGDLSDLVQLMREPDAQRSVLILDKVRAIVDSRALSADQRLNLLRAYAVVVDDLPDEKQLFFSAKDKMRYLMGDMTAAISADSVRCADVYDALASAAVGVRLEAYEISGKSRRGASAPEWWTQLGQLLAVDCVNLFASHLADGDHAQDLPARYLADFACRHGQQDELVARVRELVLTDRVSPEDVAARLVTGRTVLGPGARLELWELDNELWVTLLPDPRNRSLPPPSAVLDKLDTSWANKRLFARAKLAGVEPDDE